MESTQFFNLVPWVVFLPLIGLGINLLVGRKLGEVFAGTACQPGHRACLCGLPPPGQSPSTGHPEGVTVRPRGLDHHW